MPKKLLRAGLLGMTPALLLLQNLVAGIDCLPEKETEYIAALSDLRLRQDDPDSYADAILCLGQLESVAAVSSLITLLDYKRGFTTQLSVQRALTRIVTRKVLYPAVGALADIGKPALPSLSNVLAMNEPASERYESAFYAFRTVFWKQRAEGAAYLEMEAAGLQRTELERERLLAAADKLTEE